jgi:hypothetical protein
MTFIGVTRLRVRSERFLPTFAVHFLCTAVGSGALRISRRVGFVRSQIWQLPLIAIVLASGHESR